MSWSSQEYAAIAALLSEHAGLHFRLASRPYVEQAIRRACRGHGIRTARACLARASADASLLAELLTEVTVGETYFFRDPRHFDFLRDVVLPGSKGVRIWSAGCATGEEAWSIAMTLAQRGILDTSFVLGTDIDPSALERAERATYGTWSLRGPGEARARPWLRAEGDGQVVAPALRDRVRFWRHNLAAPGWPSIASGVHDLDVIFCRNVLIYLETPVVERIAVRLHEALAEQGWLICAASDPPLGDLADLETVVTPYGIFYGKRTRRAESQPATRCAPISMMRPPMAPPEKPAADPARQAREALAAGRYVEAEHLARLAGADALRIRALANFDEDMAIGACQDALAQSPLDGELHYLHAVLLLSKGRVEDASAAVRRLVFLHADEPAGHLLMATILLRLDDSDGARRCFRNARTLLERMPAESPVRLQEGETAGRLAAQAARQLEALEARP